MSDLTPSNTDTELAKRLAIDMTNATLQERTEIAAKFIAALNTEKREALLKAVGETNRSSNSYEGDQGWALAQSSLRYYLRQVIEYIYGGKS